jgi:hypothetical protein
MHEGYIIYYICYFFLHPFVRDSNRIIHRCVTQHEFNYNSASMPNEFLLHK